MSSPSTEVRVAILSRCHLLLPLSTSTVPALQAHPGCLHPLREIILRLQAVAGSGSSDSSPLGEGGEKRRRGEEGRRGERVLVSRRPGAQLTQSTHLWCTFPRRRRCGQALHRAKYHPLAVLHPASTPLCNANRTKSRCILAFFGGQHQRIYIYLSTIASISISLRNGCAAPSICRT